MTREGDLVLIHYHDKPTLYARIEAIENDVKKDWYQVALLVLTIPAQRVRWILRWEYIQGEPFTMGGQPICLKPVEGGTPSEEPQEGPEDPMASGPGKAAKVISFKKRP
jgi:hypothetical protein